MANSEDLDHPNVTHKELTLQGDDSLKDSTLEDTKKLPVLASSAAAATTGDLLNYYLSEVRRYPLLDQDEEKALAISYKETEDPEAAHRLVTANLRLVVKLAFQYHRQWANVLDLIQEGNIGLVEALSRYDPYREVRFSSYAQYWIRAMILRFLMDNFRMVRLGSTRHGRKLFFQLQKERDRLTEMGIHPSTKAISDSLDIPETEVVKVGLQLAAPALSFNQPYGSEDGRELSEIVSGEDDSSPEQQAGDQELGSIIKQHLETFAAAIENQREIAIWHERLTAETPTSLSALGARFGVSKERVRQVEARLKGRLKTYLEDTIGDEIAFDFDIPE